MCIYLDYYNTIQCQCNRYNWYNVYCSRYLTTELKYVDSSKVALHGTGIGGWISGSLLALDNEQPDPVLSCVILQSPIVDWSSYSKKHAIKLLC